MTKIHPEIHFWGKKNKQKTSEIHLKRTLYIEQKQLCVCVCIPDISGSKEPMLMYVGSFIVILITASY